MDHQFACFSPLEPFKRQERIAPNPLVFDRPSASGNLAVQRLARDQKAEFASGALAPPIVYDTLRSPGQPLDSPTRSSMESRFQQDFSQVCVHTDERADQSARSVGANAYTVGNEVVFGAGNYNPQSERGQNLLAHELTHVVQQAGRTTPNDGLRVGATDDSHEREARHVASGAGREQGAPTITGSVPDSRVQRFDLGDVVDVVSPGAGQAVKNASSGDLAAAAVAIGLSTVSTTAATQWAAWISNPRNRQFLDDLKASILESPQHVKEFFVDEVWEAIKEHWIQIISVTIGLLAAEALSGALAAVPEPTLLTKVVAVILQVVVIAFLVYFAGTEIISAIEEAKNWFSIAYQANGAPALVGDASRGFVRMVWHIVMTVIAVAGVRARVRGFGVPAGSSTIGGSTTSSLEEGGGNVTDISSHPKYVPHFDEPSGPVASGGSSGYYGPGGAAPKLDPFVDPAPPAPKTAPEMATGAGSTPQTGPGVQAGTAVAAAVGTGTKPRTKRQCGDPDLPWTAFTLGGTDRGEHMMAEPLTKCGLPGSPPSIRLPAWSCLQAAPGNETNFWVHAHLLHGRGTSMDLHGPGYDPRNLILTDKSLNYVMWRDVEALAISRAHIHDETLSYEVTPTHVSNSNDRRYFADGMQITLRQIDPITRQMIALLYQNTVRSNNQRTIPSNCT